MPGSRAPPETIRAAAAAGSHNSLSTLWILMRKQWQQRDSRMTRAVHRHKMQGRYLVCKLSQREQSDLLLEENSALLQLWPYFQNYSNYNSNISNQNHFNEIAVISRFARGGDITNWKPCRQNWPLRERRAGESKMKQAIILAVLCHPFLYNQPCQNIN